MTTWLGLRRVLFLSVWVLAMIVVGLYFLRGAERRTFLEVEVYPQGPQRASFSYVLDCSEPEHCAYLESHPRLLRPASGRCRKTLPKPETATVRGTVAGRPVDLQLQRKTACGERTWSRLMPVLLSAASRA